MYYNGVCVCVCVCVCSQLNAQTPVDISFIVTVGVMKADGNYIPISSAMDEHIICECCQHSWGSASPGADVNNCKDMNAGMSLYLSYIAVDNKFEVAR